MDPIVELIIRIKSEIGSTIKELEDLKTQLSKVSQQIEDIESKEIKFEGVAIGATKAAKELQRNAVKMKKSADNIKESMEAPKEDNFVDKLKDIKSVSGKELKELREEFETSFKLDDISKGLPSNKDMNQFAQWYKLMSGAAMGKIGVPFNQGQMGAKGRRLPKSPKPKQVGYTPDKISPLFTDPSTVFSRQQRAVKFPFFKQMKENFDETFKKDIINMFAPLGGKLQESDIMNIDKTMNEFVTTFGIGSTYIGEFDKRMRYLSRDLYIYGIAANQMMQTTQKFFNVFKKASGDWEGVMEDFHWAWVDAMEPVGDAMATILEPLVPIIEGISDAFVDIAETPFGKIIGLVVLLGFSFAKLTTSAVRYLGILNLIRNSTIPMIKKQRELTAAQEDHMKQIFNIGVQSKLFEEHLNQRRQEIALIGDASKRQKQFATHQKDVQQHYIQLRREIQDSLVSARDSGANLEQMLDLFTSGRHVMGGVISDMSDMERKTLISARAVGKLGDQYYYPISALKEYQKEMGITQSTTEYLKTSARDFMTLLTGKKPKQPIAEELINDMVEYIDYVQGFSKPNAYTSLGITSSSTGYKQMTFDIEEYIKIQKENVAEQQKLINTKKKDRRITAKQAGTMVSTALALAFMQPMLEALQPIFESVGYAVEIFLTPLEGLFELIADGIEWLTDMADKYMPDFVKAILGGIGTIGAMVLGFGLKWSTIGAVISAVIGTLIVIINTLSLPIIAIIVALGLLYKAWKENWFGIRDTIKKVIKTVSEILSQSIQSWIKLLTDLMDMLKGAINRLKDFLGIRDKASQPPITGAYTPNMAYAPSWDIPQPLDSYAKGGLIPQTGLYQMHRGEYVTPASQVSSGGMGTTVNHITVQVMIDRTVANNVDEREIGRIVSEQIARKLGRRL